MVIQESLTHCNPADVRVLEQLTPYATNVPSIYYCFVLIVFSIM
jgi:hypothetical protein